jgi:hypothetical protein
MNRREAAVTVRVLKDHTLGLLDAADRADQAGDTTTAATLRVWAAQAARQAAAVASRDQRSARSPSHSRRPGVRQTGSQHRGRRPQTGGPA